MAMRPENTGIYSTLVSMGYIAIIKICTVGANLSIILFTSRLCWFARLGEQSGMGKNNPSLASRLAGPFCNFLWLALFVSLKIPLSIWQKQKEKNRLQQL